MKQIAKKTDWQTKPMPEQNVSFQFQRYFTDAQMAALMHGNIPQEMEDKWFWYYENGKLYAHRSWTGFCCKQSSKISQNSPESIPLLAGPEGTIRHKVYQSYVVSL